MDVAVNHGVSVARAADRPALERLINDAFRVEQGIKKAGGERLAADGREMDDLLDRGTFLTREKDGLLAACVYVEPRGSRCYLGLLSVAPSAQGKGLGRTMMQEAETFARERGCAWMDLRVVSPRRERLVPMYERLGYVESGRQEYPAPLAEIMLAPGYFVVMSKAL